MVTTVDPTIAGYSGGDAGGMKPPNNAGVAIHVERKAMTPWEPHDNIIAMFSKVIENSTRPS